jgi:deazaflavin-dependent oxidoreductase (nitroreductase family)
MLSGALVVLEYEGRRTSRSYRIPLQYVEEGNTVVVWAGDAPSKTWWRNFADPMTATVQLRGERRPAKGRVIDDLDRKTGHLAAYVKRFPYTAADGRPRLFRSRWRPNDEELFQVAEAIVLVGFGLEA